MERIGGDESSDTSRHVFRIFLQYFALYCSPHIGFTSSHFAFAAIHLQSSPILIQFISHLSADSDLFLLRCAIYTAYSSSIPPIYLFLLQFCFTLLRTTCCHSLLILRSVPDDFCTASNSLYPYELQSFFIILVLHLAFISHVPLSPCALSL